MPERSDLLPERMLFDRGLVRNLRIRSIREAGTLEAVTAPGVI
jgi:hypothetical protein